MRARRVAVRAPVIVAVLLAVLAITAQPVSALQTNTAVGSIHDEPSDFETNSTLDNTSVRGTDAGAVVQYSPGLIDGYEDGDANVETDGFSGYSGDTGALSAQGNLVINGTQSGNLTSSNADERVYFTADQDRTDDVTQYFRVNRQLGNNADFVFFRWRNSSGTNIFTAIFRHDGTVDLQGDTIVDGGTWSPNSVYNLTVDWDFPNDQATVWINGTDTTVNLAGGTNNWDQLTTAHRTASTGSTATATIDNYEFETPSGTPGTYISGNLSVSNASTGFTNLSALTDMEAIVTVQVSDGGPWMDFATNTYTTPGNKTVDLTSATNSTFRFNVTYNPTGASPVGRMGDDGVLFTNHEPMVDNSSASPTGALTQRSQTLSIDVADPDFPSVQGDVATVEFFVDNTSIGTTTLSSNGTASMPTTFTNGGTHSWHVEVSDEYGLTNRSDYFSVQVPAELRIFNESAPTQLVDNATVDLEFYVTNGTQTDVFTRTATNGTANMTGLPADQPFIVVVRADGYVNRRIYVESLYDTQEVYLIPDSATIVEPVFTITDFSGDFPPSETVLQIQRFLNGSWVVVEGDYFGATGTVPTHLAFNERHRMILTNTVTGETRDIGPFTPTGSGEREIEVFQDRDPTVQGLPISVLLTPNVGGVAADNVTVNATFNPGGKSFSSYSFDGTYQFPNGTNTTLFSLAGSQSSGETLSTSVNLTGLEGGQLFLEASWTADDGTSGSEWFSASVQSVYSNPYTVLGVLGDVRTQLPAATVGQFTAFVALVLTVLITAAAARATPLGVEAVGAIAVFAIALFVTIQWLDREILFVAGVTWIAVAGLRRGL